MCDLICDVISCMRLKLRCWQYQCIWKSRDWKPEQKKI